MSGRSADFGPQLIGDAAKYVVAYRLTSVADISHRFHIGGRKARRLLQVLENHGVVGPAEEGRARDVLVTHRQLVEVLASLPGGDQR